MNHRTHRRVQSAGYKAQGARYKVPTALQPGPSTLHLARCTLHRSTLGFSLLELLLCVTIVSILASVAAPLVNGAMRTYDLTTAAQTVAAQIRQARMLAVSRNQTMRVRFNCPAVNSYRVVEFVGNAAIDTAANRCSEAVYPYPDQNAAARPDADRQVIRLPENATFTTVMDLEVANTGRVTRLTGCPNCVTAAGNASITLGNGSRTMVVQVTPNGQVQIQ